MKILDYFSCVPAHDLGYSGPVFQNCSNNWVPVIEYLEDLDTWASSHLFWYKELKDFKVTLCIHDFGGFGSFFPELP